MFSKDINRFILYSAILMAIVYSSPSLIYNINIILSVESLSLLTDGQILKLKYSLWQCFNSFFVLYSITIFNLSFKEKCFKQFKLKLSVRNTIGLNSLLIIVIIGISMITNLYFSVWDTKFQSISYSVYFVKFLFVNSVLIIIGLLYSILLNIYREKKQIELENERLRSENINAELSTLKEQINPHFLFNTLSSLNAVIATEEKKDSIEFVEKMSDVYRYILESNSQNLVQLKDEIRFIKAYYYLLSKRFHDALNLDINIDTKLYETKIPPMAIQLCVENAIKHNKISSKHILNIKIFVENNYVIICNNLQIKNVRDSHGIGLLNLKKRYKLIAEKDIMINKTDDSFNVNLPIISE